MITLSKFNCEQAHHLGLHETRFSTTSSKRGNGKKKEIFSKYFKIVHVGSGRGSFISLLPLFLEVTENLV